MAEASRGERYYVAGVGKGVKKVCPECEQRLLRSDFGTRWPPRARFLIAVAAAVTRQEVAEVKVVEAEAEVMRLPFSHRHRRSLLDNFGL